MFRLERDIRLECYKIKAEITGYTKERYFVAVLTYVNEQGGETTVEDLANDLLAKQKIIARVWLERCKEWGYLLEKNGAYKITQEGEDVAKNGIPVGEPVSDVWWAYYSKDPLIDARYRILRIGRELLIDDAESQNQDLHLDGDPLQSLMGENFIASYTSRIGDKKIQSIKIVKLEYCSKSSPSRTKMRLYWDLSKQKSELLVAFTTDDQPDTYKQTSSDAKLEVCRVYEITDQNITHEEIKDLYKKMSLKFHPDRNKSPDAGEMFQKYKNAWDKYKGSENKTSKTKKLKKLKGQPLPPPSENWIDVLEMMLKGKEYEWDSEHKCIVLESDNATSEEIKKGKKTMSITPNIPKYGSFDPIEIDVPIRIKNKNH